MNLKLVSMVVGLMSLWGGAEAQAQYTSCEEKHVCSSTPQGFTNCQITKICLAPPDQVCTITYFEYWSAGKQSFGNPHTQIVCVSKPPVGPSAREEESASANYIEEEVNQTNYEGRRW